MKWMTLQVLSLQQIINQQIWIRFEKINAEETT